MLSTDFDNAVGGGQIAIRVNTDEVSEALLTLAKECRRFQWELRVWSKSKGMQIYGTRGLEDITDENETTQPAPRMPRTAHEALAALRVFVAEPPKFHEADANDPDKQPIPVVLVIRNMHIAFEPGRPSREELIAVVQDMVENKYRTPDGEIIDAGKFIVGLMPAEVKLPPEVEPLFHVIAHELPDEAEVDEILKSVVVSGQDSTASNTDAEEHRRIVKAAMGLTRMQVTGVFGSSTVSLGKVDPEFVWKFKAETMNQEGLVELLENRQTYADVGGLDGFKDYLKRLLAYDPLEEHEADARYRGILTVGAPGTGKTLMAYCTGNEFKIPTLKLNPGNLMGKYVGDTERATRKMFQIIRRSAPCIVVVD